MSQGSFGRFGQWDPAHAKTLPNAGHNKVPVTTHAIPAHGKGQPGGSGSSAAGAAPPADTNPVESRGLQFVYATLGARGMGVALTAAALDMLLMGSDGRAGLQFGTIVAFASSVGDAAASAAGVPTIIDAYVTDTSFMDFSDFIGTGVMTGALMYYLGQTGNQLWTSMAFGAVAGGAGGKVGSMFLDAIMKTL